MNHTYTILTLPIVSLLCLSLPAAAQSFYSDSGEGGPNRTFAFVERSELIRPHIFAGVWSGSSGALRYANSHPGTYVVFVEEGQLHRLDDPARMTDLERAFAPMHALEAKQKALAAEQKPLAEQQRAFGAQQRAAVTPEEMARVGALQGAIGRQQGDIGALQGAVGRQQAEVGRVFREKVEAMLSACLSDGTCPRVDAETAQR